MRLVTGALGNVIRGHDYRPFGQDLSGVNGQGPKYGNFENVKRFTGKERDAETGLDYFGARYMSSAQGRFTSPDEPLFDQHQGDPQSWNLYSYVRNNPLQFIDPSGRACVNLDNGTQGDDGKGTACAGAQLGTGGNFTVGVGRDEANLIMLQGIGEGLSSLHQIATIVSEAGQGAMALEGLASLPSLARGFMRLVRGPELIRLGLEGAAESANALDKARRAIPLGNPETVRRVEQTLQDISTGTQRYSRDGIPFQNREGKLPGQGSGYYKEYTVQPKAGVTNRGAERVITGQGGEVYYTPDHYNSFVRIR
ncbi:MAG: hypothetical protein INH43_16120 [Acidobacteriaceae bacterium]|nr:hypothetical protein [Acidobacteriaceae bacterium]